MSDETNWLDHLIFKEVNERVRTDPRTINNPGTLLGWPKKSIFSSVINGGQADFDSPIGHLSGDDRALLYAHFNQRKHLDELLHAFRLLIDTSASSAGSTIIDLGCGPFTAGLSFAMTVGAEIPFRYFGADRSSAMLRLGQRLAEGARVAQALHERTSIWFGEDIEHASFGSIRGELTIVVASYLLASSTVVPELLARQINDALRRVGTGPSAILYTNSNAEYASRNFNAFRDALLNLEFELIQSSTELFTDTSKNPTNLHYALFLKPATTTVIVAETSS